DLHAVFKILLAHVSQTGSSIDKQDHLCHAAHAPPQGLLAQTGPKIVDRLEAGNIRGGLPVPHGMTLLINPMLRENAAQVSLAGFGAAVGLFAASTRQL